MAKEKKSKKSWWKVVIAFIIGGSLTTVLDLPEKIQSFRNAITGETPVERVLQTETSRSLSDDLALLLMDINPQAVVNAQDLRATLQLTVNQEHLSRLERLITTPGFDSIAQVQINRTTVIQNNAGLRGRVNDLNSIGQLTPVDIRFLKPLR